MSEWYWVLLEQSANFVEAMMMIVLLRKFLEQRHTYKWVNSVLVAGIYLVIFGLTELHSPAAVNIFVYFIISILLGFLFFQGSNVSKLLIPLLLIALIMISELLPIGVMSLAFNVSDDQFVASTQYRIFGIMISKVCLIILVYITGLFSKRKHSKIPLIYSLCLLIIPVISIVCLLTISQYVLFSIKSPLSPIWFALSAVGLLFINFLIVYLFDALLLHSFQQSQYQLMYQQAEMLSQHLREQKALQEETHRIWHDMKNHFTVIQWMVKSKSYDKLDSYMQTLNQNVTESMLKIQSGNPILDALLNLKAAEAKKYGIDLTVNAMVPSSISIDDLDLSVVFSNALDNAMEACKKLPEGRDRYIQVDTNIKNDHLLLVVKNSFDGVIKRSGERLISTKHEAGQHGIGMGNMKRAIDKYYGHMMINVEDCVFVLSVAMYCDTKLEAAI